MFKDYYLILGIGSDATPEEIEQAYKKADARINAKGSISKDCRFTRLVIAKDNQIRDYFRIFANKMYTIRKICKGAPKLVRSVLNKKREYRIQFNKEKDGCWHVDFPHRPFSHDNFAMVSGADKLLELLSDGDLFVEVSVIPGKKKGRYDGYIELVQTECFHQCLVVYF